MHLKSGPSSSHAVTVLFLRAPEGPVLFKRGQEAIDWLNRVINESILGATLIRILNSQRFEAEKFAAANTESRDIGLAILRIMSAMIPAITLAVNAATIIILLTLRPALRGDLAIDDVSLAFGDKEALKNVSFSAKGGTKTAVIGPTAAGKTQLLYVLIGLLQPTSGSVTYDGEPLDAYDKEALHRQVGFVFQGSILFNMTLRENIAFSSGIPDKDLERAIAAAEQRDFIGTLPQGLDTVVSERGTTLSSGQKQRVMLARALALNPKVFVAR
jgi:ABC-type multidrug transport system fused ATPase/permease subunit